MSAVPTPPRRVAVIFGGPSPEHDVSVLTGLQAARALEKGPFDAPIGIYWSKNGDFYRVPSTLEASEFADLPAVARPIALEIGANGGFCETKGRFSGRSATLEFDAALICCHGGPGEDGHLQGALDLAGIAYSGPSAESAALGMDKFASGAAVRAVGIPTLSRALLDADRSIGFDGPYIVKPRFGGSSIGIDVVVDEATARQRLGANLHLRRGAVVEPYRPDLFDLQIAVRSYPELSLSAIERPERTSGAEILDYGAKYVGGAGMDAAARELPAAVPSQLAAKIRDLAHVAAHALSLRGVARIDFLSDGASELYFNEINTIPGSLSRMLFVDPEIRFIDLLSNLLAEATERPASRFSSAGSDGTVLRNASSISSKLG
jgi:D-alanine-D-alanine ligase